MALDATSLPMTFSGRLLLVQIFIYCNAALVPINLLYMCFKITTTCHTYLKGPYSVSVAFLFSEMFTIN